VTDRSVVPTDAAEIHPEWLSQALAARFRGVAVSSIEVTQQRQVTNAHAQLRVSYDVSGGAPESMFCKLPPSDPQRRDAILRTGMGEREVKFYEQLAPSLAMRVPEVLLAKVQTDGMFILLLEDLDASGSVISDGRIGVSPDSAFVALEDLAMLHLRYRDPKVRDSQVPWIPSTSSTSNYGSVMLQYGLDNHRDRLSDEFAEIAELCIAHRVHAAYTVLASCQVVTFPADATPQRKVFAEAFLGRAQAAVADLEARAAIKSVGGF
jgi:hypothetical protein